MNLPRSTWTPPLQKGILCAHGTSGSFLSLGLPSIPCASVWILLPCFLHWEKGFIFKSFILAAHSTLLLSPSMSQSSFADCLEKRQNPQSQCWRHCPLNHSQIRAGRRGLSCILRLRSHARVPQRDSRELGSSQPQQGAESLQTCNTWPPAPARCGPPP